MITNQEAEMIAEKVVQKLLDGRYIKREPTEEEYREASRLENIRLIDQILPFEHDFSSSDRQALHELARDSHHPLFLTPKASDTVSLIANSES